MKETSPHLYPEAIHCTQEKGEGPTEGVAAPGPGLLIHILLPSIHILRGLHPKQPSERVGGTHSLANNSPRNRKRNRAGIEKNTAHQTEGWRRRARSKQGPFSWQERHPFPFPGTTSTPALAHPSSPTRGECKTHTRRTWPLIPGTWAESTQVFPGHFRRFLFPLEGWQPGRGGGKERRLPAEPRSRGKLEGNEGESQ